MGHVVRRVADVGRASRPAVPPSRSRTVSRSARSWHGWKPSVSALTTGTRRAGGHLGEPVVAEGPHDDRAPRTGTAPGRRRRASRPGRSGWSGVSTMIGLPPSSAMPASNESRVRRLGLSKSTATDCGPASGRCPNRSAFIAAARSSTSACSAGVRSSSRRKCRTLGSDIVAPASSASARAATNASACSAVRISGGASRIASGWTALTRKPGVAQRGRRRPPTPAR